MKRKKQNSMNGPIGFMVIVLVLLIGIVSVQVTNLYARNLSLKEEHVQLEKRLQIECEKAKELTAKQKCINTDEFVEKMAREKLGLIKPNEVIFINKD